MSTPSTSVEETVLPEHERVLMTFNKIQVLNNPHLLPRTIAQLHRGEYETPEIDTGLANIRPGDRIVEMGTGAGIVSAILAKQIPDIKIRSFEANPRLIPHIKKMHDHNGLSDTVEVFNTLIVSDTDAPERMDFSIARNFLGSSLTEFTSVEGREKVSVETKQYSDLAAEFPHNVIVMDIEGAELDFLKHVDFSSVELLMLEIHPPIYGQKGRREILHSMSKLGFRLDPATSKDLVLTFKKPERFEHQPDLSRISFRYDLDPNKPLASQTRAYDNAVLVRTPGSEGYQIKASVFDAERERIPSAISWISHILPATLPRKHPIKRRIKHRAGTWLFGGRHHPHFGHFLCETIGRLWAIDHIDEPYEGILFFPSSDNDLDSFNANFASLSEILDFDANVQICDDFQRVDRLIVPLQGCGIDRLMLSSPETRSFITRRLKRDFQPTGCEKLYISRSGDFGRHGRIYVGEQILEQLLEADGYTIFHPEQHSWQEQLRHYLSAKVILGSDGSAMHLANFTGRSDLKIGIIKRRTGWTGDQLARQGQFFGVGETHVFQHLGRLFALSGYRGTTFSLMPELMLNDLCEALKAQGFISNQTVWQNLSNAELREQLEAVARVAQMDVRQVQNENQSLSEFEDCEIAGQPQVFFADNS